MHTTEILDAAERLICKGIEEISKRPDLDPQSLDMMGKATDALKDIHEIRKSEESGGYERYSRYDDGGYGDGYGRRRRDSMGRFADYETPERPDRRAGDWEMYRR